MVVIPGAVNATYITGPVSLSDNNAQFTCEVSNSVGSVTSDPATLTVIQLPPTIVTHPADQMVNEGQSVQFSVVANGSDLEYQWQKDGVAIPGATLPDYSIASASVSDNGSQFTCVVSNPAGSVTSDPALLTVIPINNFQMHMIAIGASSAAKVSNSNYTAKDVIIGSNANGLAFGSRFKLFLK